MPGATTSTNRLREMAPARLRMTNETSVLVFVQTGLSRSTGPASDRSFIPGGRWAKQGDVFEGRSNLHHVFADRGHDISEQCLELLDPGRQLVTPDGQGVVGSDQRTDQASVGALYWFRDIDHDRADLLPDLAVEATARCRHGRVGSVKLCPLIVQLDQIRALSHRRHRLVLARRALQQAWRCGYGWLLVR